MTPPSTVRSTPARQRARLLSLIAAVVGIASMMWLSPSNAQGTAGAYGIAFKSQNPYVAQAGGELGLGFTMTAPEGATVTFTVSSPVTNVGGSRDLLDEWIAGKRTPSGIGGGPLTLPVAALEFLKKDDGSYTIPIPISPSDPQPQYGFTLTDPGVYPLNVTLADAGSTAIGSFTTFMVVLAATTVTAPFQLAPIVPFEAPVALQPDGTYRISADDAHKLAVVHKLLDDHKSAGLTLAPRPETVDALTHLGANSGTPTADQLGLSLSSRHAVSTSFVDLDVNAWTAAGLTGELGRQLSLGADTLNARVSSAAPVDSSTWIARRALTPDALDALRELGIERMVVPSDVIGGLDGRAFDGRRNLPVQVAEQQPFDIENGAGGRFRSVEADARLAGRLTATPNTALNAQIAIADLAVLACGPTQATQCKNLPNVARGVALDVPDSTVGLASFGELLDRLALPTAGLQAPLVTTVGLDQLLTSTPATVSGSANPAVRTYQPSDAGAGPSMSAYRDELHRIEPQITGYRSMVDTTDPSRATALTNLVDVSGAADEPAVQQRYLDAVRTRLDEVLASIHAPLQEPATLTSTDAVIQLQIKNDLDYPVAISVALSSDKLEFADGRPSTTIDRILAPKATTGVKVDVRARASGTFVLETKISSPDGSIHLDETNLEIRSTAFSRLGLVLTICAGFFLVAWWIKHFRATRRARKLVDPDEVDQLRNQLERDEQPARS